MNVQLNTETHQHHTFKESISLQGGHYFQRKTSDFQIMQVRNTPSKLANTRATWRSPKLLW